MASDEDLIGRRVRLIFTNDPYAHLKCGDMGTITHVSYLPQNMGGENPEPVE
jgi:hypothetical protein